MFSYCRSFFYHCPKGKSGTRPIRALTNCNPRCNYVCAITQPAVAPSDEVKMRRQSPHFLLLLVIPESPPPILPLSILSHPLIVPFLISSSIFPIRLTNISSTDGIAAATIGSILNYLLLGFAPQLDRFYLHSFEILLACAVVFTGVGNLGYTLLEYRLGHRSFFASLFENLRWVPFL